MDDEEVLDWIRRQAAGAKIVFSVCTGALLCGAAGLLKGRNATTYWAALSLLPYFGATPVEERVVVDGNLVCAAGVTAGIDGALKVAAHAAGRQGRRNDPALYAIRARAALRRRIAGHRAGGRDRRRAGLKRGDHGPAGGDGAPGCGAARHRASPGRLTLLVGLTAARPGDINQPPW